MGTEVVFWGKVHWSLGREGWQSRWFIFITNTQWVKVFCLTDAVFRAEMWRCVGRTDRRTDASLRISVVLLSSYKLHNDSYSYYISFVWSYDVALWDISPYLVEWGTCVVIRLLRPTRPRSVSPAYPFTLGQFTNNTAVRLPPETDQRRNEISPSASGTFPQRRLLRIGVGSPHANSSVNGALCILQYRDESATKGCGCGHLARPHGRVPDSLLLRLLTKRHCNCRVPIDIKSLGANFQYLIAHLYRNLKYRDKDRDITPNSPWLITAEHTAPTCCQPVVVFTFCTCVTWNKPP